ncbi:MAG: cobaltochelatase subunit CobN [Acidimicrobiales bacterium]
MRSVVDDIPAEVGGVRWFHPDRVDAVPSPDGAAIVVVRLLGGIDAWKEPLALLRAACIDVGAALVAVGGEVRPDAAMAAVSTVPAGVAREAHRYLCAGGPANMANLVRFLSDTIRMTGLGFDPPVPVPDVGVWDGAGIAGNGSGRDAGRPLVAVVFYRAHLVAGNTGYVSTLCDAIDAAGADAVAIWTYSLRRDAEGVVPALALCSELGADIVITSTLAAGSSGAGGEGWMVPALSDLAVPIVQAPASSRSRADWAADRVGLSPFDVASGVAIPEFDGRVIGPTYAFKEIVDDGDRQGGEIVATRADPERTARLAGLSVRTAMLSRKPPSERRIAIVLSAYPTSRARLGNAVGLDTPASAIALLGALADAGYAIDRHPVDGDELMSMLAAGCTYDDRRLDRAQLQMAAGSLSTQVYGAWYASLPAESRSDLERSWGPAPGDVFVDGGRLHFPGIDLGNVLVAIQPPRGFGPDPVATYHAPDLPPPHHYLAFYRWLAAGVAEGGWGADALVHLGKHGTLEWLPGKALAPSASCFPDAAIADLPFFYPFVVNDPGEGTQAKRRSHAVIVDHLPPPMTRADTYDDLFRLEQLLDAYAQVQVMDPDKLPELRGEVWDLLVQAEIHRDLELGDAPPGDREFDDVLLHVDGYLCALKDAQIRGGLHVLGQVPTDGQLIDNVLAITRLPQAGVPSLRATVGAELGIAPDSRARPDIDRIEAECRLRVERLAGSAWEAGPGDGVTLRWVAATLVPNLRRTADEIGNLLEGLAGRPVPAGPSGAPSRGGAHVLPTGRNFYSVDPKAVPSPLAWKVGQALADRLIEKHLDECGTHPRTVGLVMWGTAAMRTAGDDAAEALALLGARPVWDAESRRVTGLEVIPLTELGRPRVDVTLRISGFFRDAFPHVIDLIDDAVHLVGELDEPEADNPVRDAGTGDPRLWGPPPGGYGSGIDSVLEQRAWRTDDDLAEAYLAWSGFAYGRHRDGRADPDGMRRRFAAIEVAVKNQDNREHDIFDSADYLEDHGGMVAAVRSLRGEAPKAWFGDSSDPARPEVRSLKEEAARVVRSRVLNPRWIEAMRRHGYKGAFELAATVDYLFGYDATAHVVEDWMYERVANAYVADPAMRAFFGESNPWALRAIAERLLEADQRDLWDASPQARQTLVDAVLEAEGWEESR